MPLGLYKIRNGWVTQDSAIVRHDDGTELEVPRDQYESQNYNPPLDDLPTRGNYEAQNANRT